MSNSTALLTISSPPSGSSHLAYTAQACSYVMPYRAHTETARISKGENCMSWISCPFARSADGDESHNDGGGGDSSTNKGADTPV